VAALLLARAGVAVRLVDRATFPRDKLCGDTVNPGTLSLLRRLEVARAVEERGLRVHGMRVTGPRGIAVDAAYPRGRYGVAITRCELDDLLRRQAVAAGADFISGVVVRSPILGDDDGRPRVQGVEVDTLSGRERWPVRVVIAADGRRSALAFALRLTRHALSPRRWAIGAYFDAEPARGAVVGEMHIRHGRYIGVAPLPGGRANVCVVMPPGGDACDFGDPAGLLMREIAAEPLLRDRFAGQTMVRPPVMLGPLAVEPTGRFVDGLLLAGDAAGFIDPMTGDGLRFAVRGGELAAAAALDAISHGWSGVHARYAHVCRREFGAKWRFNRGLRTLVSSSHGVRAAAFGARFAPGLVRQAIVFAGDCGL
jgi:flavin-dependent dehydrogenase